MLFGAPSLPITKPPVTPVPSWTRPLVDPHAISGQWIWCNTNSFEFAHPFEFYDNVLGDGGGLADWRTIEGIVQNIQYASGAGSNILSFVSIYCL